jgi:hypothetical protein
MEVGDLVEDLIDGIGVVLDTHYDEDNHKPLYLVHFAYGYRGWYYEGCLQAVKKCP